MADTKEDDKPEILLGDFESVIAETAKSNPPDVTGLTNWLFKNEVLVFLFGERFQGWFEGFRRIFTILFVPVLFLLVLLWIAFVAYFLWRAAFYRESFGLSDNVLIAMITSTTATIIGLFHYANRWLFQIRSDDPSEKSDSN